jgi:hypothetical protein
VGLCAPAQEPETEVVVSASSIEGTKGGWNAKQRLILTAMSIQTARARLTACTPTFALLRTPVTFLVSGIHQEIDVCYGLLVDPRTGSLRTVVWPEITAAGKVAQAREPAVNVFDSPMDIKANKVLGSIPVTWSFAVRELPPGTDLALPEELTNRLEVSDGEPDGAADIEQAFLRLMAEGAKDSIPNSDQ